jgi:hypothetical protein
MRCGALVFSGYNVGLFPHRGQTIIDFIRTAWVLIAIPLAGILVPAVLTWARDLSLPARRMRSLEEQSKVVSFWDGWTKAVSSTALPKENSNRLDEVYLTALAQDARRELIRAGQIAKSLYRPKVDPAYAKYRLTFKEFHAYRSKLPWYRRALLLYGAPNPYAARVKSYAHFALATATLEFAGLVQELLWPKKLALIPPPPAWLMTFVNTHHVFAYLVAWVSLVLVVGVLVLGCAFFRWRTIVYENDPRYYLWEDAPETGIAYRAVE